MNLYTISHPMALNYLRQELARFVRLARKGAIENLMEINYYIRVLVLRCPENLRDMADKLQHKIINHQVTKYYCKYNMEKRGVDCSDIKVTSMRSRDIAWTGFRLSKDYIG